MPSPPEATVIVPVRNGERLLGRQLAALSRQSAGDALEVVVVDSGSTDGTAAAAEAHASDFARFLIVRAGEPGIALARNAGAAAAAAPVLLFCDHDDAAAPDWAEKMAKALEEHDVVGGALSVDRTSRRALLWRTEPPPAGLATTMKRPYATGASLGVRRSVLDALGGFSVEYTSSHDDVEFCWRAQDAGYTLGYAPDAVMHYALRDTLAGLARQRLNYGRSYAQLHADCNRRGRRVARGSLRAEAALLLRTAAALPRSLADDVARGQWTYDASWNAGRWLGNLRYRTMCPPTGPDGR